MLFCFWFVGFVRFVSCESYCYKCSRLGHPVHGTQTNIEKEIERLRERDLKIARRKKMMLD